MMAPEMEPTLDDPGNSGRSYGRAFVGGYPSLDTAAVTDVTEDPHLPVPRVSDSNSRLSAVRTDPSADPYPAKFDTRTAAGSSATSRTGGTPAGTSQRGGNAAAPHRRRAVTSSRTSRTRPPMVRLRLVSVLGLLLGATVMLASAALGQSTGTQVPVLSTLAAAPVPPASARYPSAGRPLRPRNLPGLAARRRDRRGDRRLRGPAPVRAGRRGNADPVRAGRAAAGQPELPPVGQRAVHRSRHQLPSRPLRPGPARFGPGRSSRRRRRGSAATGRCRCQAARFSRSGALYSIKGKVAELDQSDIRAAGLCLGIDGKFIGDPVSCSRPHAVQSVGSIDLSSKFSKYPQVSDQDNYLQPQCTKLASSYAGGQQALAGKNLSVIWDNLSQESWNAGTRKVACNLAAQLPDHSGFAPITGDAKGKVTVGDLAAPPAPQTSAPGAPADNGDGGGPAPGSDQQANGSDNPANPVRKPELPNPPSQLNRPPRLPQLPNPFADNNGNPQPNPLDNNNPRPNPLGRQQPPAESARRRPTTPAPARSGGDNGKPLLPGAAPTRE